MEFISAEEFLRQPKEVQELFLEWANDNLEYCDLVQDNGEIMLYKDFYKRVRVDFDSYPLFTECQLRKFIEDKTDDSMNLKLNIWKYENKNVTRIDIKYNHSNENFGFKVYGNTLQAYWKVACEIAKENENND